MRTKRKGESGSPYLRPLEGVKRLEGAPLSSMEKLVLVTSSIPYLILLWLKP